jgi:tetratricopeptide (TPR) repeat protein
MMTDDLVECPYCFELIQRRATRCKHCRANLTRPEPPQVGGHGTVGGDFGVTIGGENNQVGDIHLTLADLDGVDPATKTAIRQRYEQIVRDHPEQAQYHFALGLSYLDQGLYDLATASLQRALGKTTHEADILYYLALALIGGRRPRTLMLSTIRQIESYLTAAIRLENRKSHYKLLLAAVKSDYYASNGLRIHPPTVDQLLSEAGQGEILSREIGLMLLHLPLPEGGLLHAIKAYL